MRKLLSPGSLATMPAALLLLAALVGGHLGAAVELADAPAGLAVLTVTAAATLLLTLLVALRTAPVAVGGGLLTSTIRQQAERTAFLPLRDPSAPGRPRPRAPSALPRAA